VTRIAAVVTAIALLALAAGPSLAASPKPKLGRTVVVKATDGSVLVKPRKGKRFKLKRNKAVAIAVGATVDATNGKVKLTSARKSKGTQSGEFSQGAFVVSQRKSDSLTDLKLAGGDFSGCSTAAANAKPISAARKKRRRLFGRAHGRFRTRGRSSSATVRGTDWLTEDRCEGTVTENKSPNETSKVDTQSRDLKFELEPGQKITYYCNKFRIEPDTYCVMLLAYPDQGIVAGGIITQMDVETYRFCVQAPDGQFGCSGPLPLAEDDENSFRMGVFACPVRQVGTFEFGWSLDGQYILYPTLSLTLNVEGPNEHCQTVPPTEQPIAKRLPRL
jgi:hypothetical protein